MSKFLNQFTLDSIDELQDYQIHEFLDKAKYQKE